MLQHSKLTSNKRYYPTIRGSKCFWMLPSDFNEKIGQASLGVLQKFFGSQEVRECVINLEKVTWADPVPLLCLGLLLAESNIDKSQIILDLGYIKGNRSNKDHLVFLKFFAKQGFLTAFGPYVSFQHKDAGKPIEDFDSLALQLSHIAAPSYFNNANCIFAKILPVRHYEKDLPALQKKVEELLHEMKDRTDQTAIVADPLARDALYQKVRKILFELLLNVAEHSHSGGDQCFAGVYARVRTAKPTNLSEAKFWNDLFDKKTISLYGQKSFRPNHYAEWLELFICDTGVGLTDNIKNWIPPDNDPAAADVLKKVQKAENRFTSICHQIFNSSFSSKHRHDERRTAVTGLRHLGHLLGMDNDHCRMVVHETKYPGGWAGDHHPWEQQKSTYSRTDIVQTIIKKKPEYRHLIPVTGTVYAFSIQPGKESGLPCQHCGRLDEEGRQGILKALKERSTFDSQDFRFAGFDHKTMDCCPSPGADSLPDSPYDVIVLRPPALMNKSDIARWKALVIGARNVLPKVSCKQIFFADLSPYQTLVFYDLLQHFDVHPDVEIDWFLISDHWDVFCLSSKKGDYSLEPALQKAKEFILPINQKNSFLIADLSVLLRQMDSEIFWSANSPPEMDPFFNQPVIWKESLDPTQQLILPRYLDLPVALINPLQYQACLRSLKRLLALFPSHQPKPVDDLVLSLVREAALSQRTEAGQPKIMVGSIVVTGKTLERLVQNEAQNALHIFFHSEVDSPLPVKPLVALLWKSSLPGYAVQRQINGTQPWRRITNTSYIAPHGEKSVSVLRYRPKKDGSLDFNNPYYERTPEDTYNDFKRLGILKIGHWHYGSRHDLLTINMRLAFRFSFQELGPLYIWLQKQFEDFFAGPTNAKAQLLVYPSHPVTDTLFDRIRQDAGFQDVLPEGGMIPIKYVGRRTVSPLLASHLVKERIRQILARRQWKTWSVVLFDDGTISGKHLRETTQLLQSLGAESVYLLVVLDRSGLPVQEKVFNSFLERHKRFWRWDVPGLGSQGKCPLCKALAVVEIHLHKVSSARICERLKKWIEIWNLRDVDTEWYRDQIQSTSNIEPPLEITFGVDPKRFEGGKQVEKRLQFSDASAATSLVMELTRLTPRMDIAIKKAERLHLNFPDAALEMLTSQLFLYLDEMTEMEIVERYEKLLAWLWEGRDETPFTALSGLCFTLLENDLIRDVWIFARKLLAKYAMSNLDIIFVVSYLCNRYELLTGEEYSPGEGADEIEIKNYLLLDRAIGVKRHISALLAIFISNPYHPDSSVIHQTEFRENLNNIADGKADNLAIKQTKINNDLKQLYEANKCLSQNLHVFEISHHQEKELERFIDNLSSQATNIESLANDLRNYLYNEDSGIIKKINDSLFYCISDPSDFAKFISSCLNFNEEEWRKIINEKIKSYKLSNRYHGEIAIWIDTKKLSGKEAIAWNNEMPVFSQSLTNIGGEKWFYCDHFYKRAIKDILTNVLYASDKIKDPFTSSQTSIATAHMWWRIIDSGDFLVFETANATENREIKLRQHTAVACIERTGGRVEAHVDDCTAIAYSRLYLPRFSYFLGEANGT